MNKYQKSNYNSSPISFEELNVLYSKQKKIKTRHKSKCNVDSKCIFCKSFSKLLKTDQSLYALDYTFQCLTCNEVFHKIWSISPQHRRKRE